MFRPWQLFYWVWRPAGSAATVSRHGASVDLAARPAAGAVLRARRLLHRSDPGGGSRGDHPRAFRSRAPGPPRGAGERRHAGADAGAGWARGGQGETQQALRWGETLRIGDVRVWLQPAGHVLGSAQVAMEYQGARAVVSGDYKRTADPTCAGFVPVPVRRVRDRGDVRPAGVPPSSAGAGDRPAAGQRGAVSGPHACRRLLRAGQVPAADRAAARGGLGRADLAARRAGVAVPGLRGARRGAGRSAAGHRGGKGRTGGRDRAGAARCGDRPVGAAAGGSRWWRWRPAGCGCGSGPSRAGWNCRW